MEIPRISFNEANVGARPILNNLRNRIGIVGQFSRGPANIFSFVDGFTEFANIYGSDAALGSIGYQAAWDQGARDFGIVRVLGHRKDATGSAILSGNPTKNNELSIDITGVQDAVLAIDTTFDMDVSVNGSNYTGNQTGHYVFRVVDDTTGAIKVAFKFVDITDAGDRVAALAYVTQAMWDAIELADNVGGVVAGEGLVSPDGIATSFDESTVSNTNLQVELGLNVKFGVSGETLFFTEGQQFTNYVENYVYSVPIVAGETSVDVTNRFLSALQGSDPLGEVTTDIQFLDTVTDGYQSTVTFKLDGSLDGVGGVGGTRYTYELNLAEPDAVINVNNISWNDTTPTILTTDDDDALFLQPSDAISIVTGNTTLNNPTGTVTVSTVTANAGGPGIHEITLNTALTGTTDAGPITIQFLAAAGGFQVSGYQQTKGFIGGVDGPTNARRTFYTLSGQRLIDIIAISPGQWGNNIRIDIVPINSVSYRINVTDLQGNDFNPPILSESFVVDLTKSDALDENGVITALNESNLIRGTFLPKVDNPTNFNTALLSFKPERLAPVNSTLSNANTNSVHHPSFFGPSRLVQVSLEGGSDGPIITEDDYLLAIDELAERNVNYLVMPGVYTNFKRAQAALVNVAENSTEVEGLKIAILSARPRLRPGAAADEFKHVNSVRAVAVAGWSTYAGQVGSPTFGCSPDAIYAGKLATIGFTVSPAARSTAGPVRNITDVDTRSYTSRSSLQLYTDGRMEVLFPELNLGGFFFLNGRTSSSDTAWDRVIIRRTYDVIRQDLFVGLQPYKSEPHTTLLRRQIETSVNAYFSNLARNGKIANFGGAICNESNNPPENYINGQLNISVSFLPLYAADYINITITRNTESGLEIGVG